MKQQSITDTIRQALTEADDHLSVPQVRQAVEDAGLPTYSVKALLGQRARAGEFIRAEILGVMRYTINPDFKPSGTRGPEIPEAEILEALDSGPMSTAQLVGALGGKRSPDAFRRRLRSLVDSGKLVQEKRGQEAWWSLPGSENTSTPDAAASPAVSPGTATPSPDPLREESTEAASGPSTPAAQLFVQAAVPHELTARLDAIIQDIEDALDDACRAELSHAFIRHLVEANGAAGRAARQLVR